MIRISRLIRRLPSVIRNSYIEVLSKLKKPVRMEPDFIIMGAQKCGTTSLYNYLIKHPCIELAIKKEIHFFDFYYFKGLEWYKTFFPTLLYKKAINRIFKRESIVGEATPYYFLHPYAYKRIHKHFPNVKLIILLRNPVDRAYSHYNHEVRKGYEKLSFEKAIKREKERMGQELDKMNEDQYYYSYNFQHYTYLMRGIYIHQLKKLYRCFSKDQIEIIKSEDLYNNPQETLKQVFEFLNLPNMILKKYKKYNYGVYPNLDNKMREWLNNYYKPYNHQLYEYLGRNFKWDN